MRRWGLRFAVVSAICLWPSPPPAHADAAQARAHFDKGRAYFQVDEYRQAIDEFKAAHVEKPDPAFLYNIAECYRHLGEIAEALTYYRRFLSLAPANDRSRPAVEKRVAELQKTAPAPRPLPPNATTPPPAPMPTTPPPATVEPPVALLVGEPPPSAATEAPFYKRGWFIATAAAVVVVGAGIGVWAASRAPGPPDTPLGNQHAF
jgi:tetratricopeptide (TPR) repeat protein